MTKMTQKPLTINIEDIGVTLESLYSSQFLYMDACSKQYLQVCTFKSGFPMMYKLIKHCGINPS